MATIPPVVFFMVGLMLFALFIGWWVLRVGK